MNGVSQNPDNCSLVDKTTGLPQGYYFIYSSTSRNLTFTTVSNLWRFGMTGNYTLNCIFTNNGVTESVISQELYFWTCSNEGNPYADFIS